MFTSSVFAEKRSGLSVMKNAMQRYLNSKLGVLYLAMELDRRLQETKCTNVLVNAVHPGKLLCFTRLHKAYSSYSHLTTISIYRKCCRNKYRELRSAVYERIKCEESKAISLSWSSH
jgi:NAD(P)-dependent dehydrogenase (short-subunit alcohol dehydrogenase family)